MKYKKNIISNITVHILALVFGFISSIIIARGLGAENQGQFAFYVLIFGLLASYGHFGMTTSISYFIKKTKFEENEIINTNLTILTILGFIYFIIIFIFKNCIFKNNILLLLLIWSIYYFSMLISTCLNNIYIAHENIYICNRYVNLNTMLKFILILIMFMVNGISIISVSIIYATLELLKFILFYRKLDIKYKFIIKSKILIEELKYGIPLYFSALFLYLNLRVDQIMIKVFLGSAALGVYALSVTLSELANAIPDSVVSAFTGRLYNCKEDEKEQIVALTIKFSFYMTVFISLVGVCCKPLVGLLYGHEYVKAGISMIILLFGMPFWTIGMTTSVFFYTNGKTKTHMFISLCVLITNFVLNFIMIPKYGIYGAAMTSSISYFVYAVIYIIFLRKYNILPKHIFFITKKDLKYFKKTFFSGKLGFVKQ